MRPASVVLVDLNNLAHDVFTDHDNAASTWHIRRLRPSCPKMGSGHPHRPPATVTLIVGVPQGLNSLANQNALYHQADPARMGSSAGLLQTCTYLGAIIAAAAGGAFLGHGADTRGLHHRALFTLAVAVLFLVAILPDRSLRRIGSPSSSTSSTAATA